VQKRSSRSLGQQGEELAAKYLEQKGYRILERNYATAFGEIDLIASYGLPDEPFRLVFVEVKMRRNRQYGYPEESVTKRKLTHLIHAIQGYLQEKSNDDIDWQIDVISVELGSNNCERQIIHLENVTAPLNFVGDDG